MLSMKNISKHSHSTTKINQDQKMDKGSLKTKRLKRAFTFKVEVVSW